MKTTTIPFDKRPRSFSYRDLLVDEYKRRKQENSNYSLRAFARDLGIGAGALSDVLSLKRNLSKRNAIKVAERLEFSQEELDRVVYEIKIKNDELLDNSFHVLEEQEFEPIADWYYLAILGLARLRLNRADPAWVAEQLGIPLSTAKSAIAKLVGRGLARVENGKLVRTEESLSTNRDFPSEATKRYHRGNLQRALLALDEEPVERRDFSSMTMAIPLARIPEAKNMILRFKRRLLKLMESKDPDEVYTLAVQFFPLQRQKKKILP